MRKPKLLENSFKATRLPERKNCDSLSGRGSLGLHEILRGTFGNRKETANIRKGANISECVLRVRHYAMFFLHVFIP